MAITTCSECGREVSDRAMACPGCGAPVAMDRESAGSGVAHLATVQSTSKALKLQTAMSVSAIVIGVVLVYAGYDLGADTIGIGGLLTAGGLLWYIVTRTRIWWHHG